MKNSLRKILIAVLSLTCLFAMMTATIFTVGATSDAASGANNALIYMETGAQAKITKDGTSSGIRFQTNINKDTYDGYITAEKTVTFGTIIVPTEYITAAGGYTFEKLNAWASENGKTIGYVESSGFINADTAQSGGYYYYYGSMVDIFENNYVRDFSGIGYICVDGEYSYAEYTDENQSRNIYDIMCTAYEENTVDSDIAETYLDAVASVTIDAYGNAVITGPSGYVSPYTIEQGEASVTGFLQKTSTYTIVGADGEVPSTVLVNGEVQTIADGDTVTFSKTSGYQVSGYENVQYNRATASYTADNDYIDVTLGSNAGSWGDGNYELSTYPTDLSYVAYDGTFGLNSLISLDFEGAYMPLLGFYMDGGNYNVLTNVDKDTSIKGSFMYNGMENKTSDAAAYGSFDGTGASGAVNGRLRVDGPNRITNKVGNGTDRYYEEQDTAWVKRLMRSSKTYRIAVGFVEEDGAVKLVGFLFDITDGNMTFLGTLADSPFVNKISSIDESVFSGKLIIYGAVKANDTKIRFNNKPVTYSAVADEDYQTVKFEDGKINFAVTGASGYVVTSADGKSYTTDGYIEATEDKIFQYMLSSTTLSLNTFTLRMNLLSYIMQPHTTLKT